MRRTSWTLLALTCFSLVPAVRAGSVADLNADWSDSNNPNTASFGTWSYRQGSSLLPEVPNFNGAGTGGFTVTQPAWAPSMARPTSSGPARTRGPSPSPATFGRA